jgi:hypothetical protein
MKLSPEEVSRVVNKLIAEWKEKKFVSFSVPDEKIRLTLNDIFLKELKVEDDLNRDAEKLLEKYEKEFAKGALDRRKMFSMVKAQLAKERKVVL